MPEAITKYAVNSSLGTPGFLPLNEIIEKKVSIKTQHIVVKIPEIPSYKEYLEIDTTIEPVSVSKSIIIPTGYIQSQEGIYSISYRLVNSELLRLTVTGRNNIGCTMSLTILTIGE